MNLRDYQEAAVTAAIGHLAKGVNPLVIAPTGAGKTVISAEIIKRWQVANPGKLAVFVAHRKELIQQAAATIARFGITNVKCLSVFASDWDVSAEDRKTALVVFDEAHHAVAATWNAFSADFTGPKVAVTATPDRSDRQRLEDVGFALAYQIAIRTLIEAGHLVRPMAYKMPITLSPLIIRGAYEDQVVSLCDLVIAELKRWDRKHTIFFLPDVDTCRRFADVLTSRGLKSASIEGTMHPYIRSSAIERFKTGGLDCLCNVNILTEGFDAPETDCVVMFRPTQSRSLFAQMIGRGLRTAPGKTDCLILDPMWVAGENTFQPADAFTMHPLSKSKQKDGGCDPLSEADMIDQETEQAVVARIIAEASKAEAKEAREKGLIDLSTAVSCFGYVLPSDEAGEVADGQQRATLERFKVHASAGIKATQADWLIRKLYQRQALGLATVKQVRKLVQFGVRNASTLTMAQASVSITSDWRMSYRR